MQHHAVLAGNNNLGLSLVNSGRISLDSKTQQLRDLLSAMLVVVDSCPDALTSRYNELRDHSYELATQVRTAALPSPEPRMTAKWVGNTLVVL